MSRFTKTLVAAAALTIMASTAFAGSFNPAQEKDIQAIVSNYLQNNPQVIISSLQSYQQKQMQEAEKTIKSTQKDASQYVNALFHDTKDPVAGKADAPVTVVEFFDYQCTHCVDMAPVIAEVIKSNPNVRFVFKEFPIRGPLSDYASRAALAANMQGKYLPFHDELMKTKQPYTQEAILAAAKTVGLNIEQLQKDMDSPAVKDQIKANMKLAQDLKLLGTPAFFVGKTNATTSSSLNYVPGQMNMEQLQTLIKKTI